MQSSPGPRPEPVSQPCQVATVPGAAPVPPGVAVWLFTSWSVHLRLHSDASFSHTLAQVQQQLTTHRDEFGRPPQPATRICCPFGRCCCVRVAGGSQGGPPQTRTADALAGATTALPDLASGFSVWMPQRVRGGYSASPVPSFSVSPNRPSPLPKPPFPPSPAAKPHS